MTCSPWMSNICPVSWQSYISVICLWNQNMLPQSRTIKKSRISSDRSPQFGDLGKKRLTYDLQLHLIKIGNQRSRGPVWAQGCWRNSCEAWKETGFNQVRGRERQVIAKVALFRLFNLYRSLKIKASSLCCWNIPKHLFGTVLFYANTDVKI